jgi:hypothetical protein
VEIGSSAEVGSSSSSTIGLDRHRAGDAQALLLAAGQRQAALLQLVLDLVPQRGLAQRPLDALVHVALAEVLVQAHAEGDVLVDRHRERRGLLEHHADLRAQQVHVLLLVEDVLGR